MGYLNAQWDLHLIPPMDQPDLDFSEHVNWGCGCSQNVANLVDHCREYADLECATRKSCRSLSIIRHTNDMLF